MVIRRNCCPTLRGQAPIRAKRVRSEIGDDADVFNERPRDKRASLEESGGRAERVNAVFFAKELRFQVSFDDSERGCGSVDIVDAGGIV